MTTLSSLVNGKSNNRAQWIEIRRNITVTYGWGTQNGVVAATLVGFLQLKALRNFQEGDGDDDGDGDLDLRLAGDGNIPGRIFRRV